MPGEAMYEPMKCQGCGRRYWGPASWTLCPRCFRPGRDRTAAAHEARVREFLQKAYSSRGRLKRKQRIVNAEHQRFLAKRAAERRRSSVKLLKLLRAAKRD
jgi:hypothetical protein